MTLQTTWNLSHLFRSDDDPAILESRNASIAAVEAFARKWSSRSDYLENASTLAEAIEEFSRLDEEHGLNTNEVYYFYLRHDQDTSNTEITARYNNAIEIADRLSNQVIFFTLSLAKLPAEKRQEFLTSPVLEKHRRFLTILFKNSAHLLSEAEERICTLKRQTALDAWSNMLETLMGKESRQIEFPDGSIQDKPFESFVGLCRHPDEKTRRQAAAGTTEIREQFKNVAEHELNAVLGYKKVEDELRSYDIPERSRLIEDEMSKETIDALVEAVSSANTIAHRFMRLKANILKKDTLTYFERAVPVGQVSTTYNYEKSLEITRRAFTRLHPRFVEILDGFASEGRIDVYPQTGKRGGAYQQAMGKHNPVYILLNHVDDLASLTTLAHELGHGINMTLTFEKQENLYGNVLTSTAEVASIFMEDFALHEAMIEMSDEDLFLAKMATIDEAIACTFRQIAGYRFERELHEEFRKVGYLSADKISGIFRLHMQNYLGEAVEFPAGTELNWIDWHHFRYFFYIYSYASGLLISKALQAKVRENPAFIEKVVEFLSAGTSKSPEELFASMGLDIRDPEFWNLGIQMIEKDLIEAESLAKKLGKI